MDHGSDLFWLYAVNIALGLVALVCIVAVGGATVRELWRRRAHRAALALDDHVFLTPELGPMMADGGERLDKKADQPPPEPR
jgi:hypothetical protein